MTEIALIFLAFGAGLVVGNVAREGELRWSPLRAVIALAIWPLILWAIWGGDDDEGEVADG